MNNLEKGRKNGKEANRRILKRTVFLMLFFGIVTFLILVGRLWYLQVIQHDELEEMAIEQQTSEQSVTAQRGTIYDTKGNVLAISSTVYDVIISPKAITEKQEELNKSKKNVDVQTLIADGLAEILGNVDAETIA